MESIMYASFYIKSHTNGIAQIDPNQFRIEDYWRPESYSNLTERVSAEENMNM